MICSANQLAGFYMMATLAFNELNQSNLFHKYLKLKFIIKILIADNCMQSTKGISKGNSLNFLQITIPPIRFLQVMKVYKKGATF